MRLTFDGLAFNLNRSIRSARGHTEIRILIIVCRELELLRRGAGLLRCRLQYYLPSRAAPRFSIELRKSPVR